MKLGKIEKFEIIARAFSRMTGKMRPGKDMPAACHDDPEARRIAWMEWSDKYAECCLAVLAAVEEITE